MTKCLLFLNESYIKVEPTWKWFKNSFFLIDRQQEATPFCMEVFGKTAFFSLCELNKRFLVSVWRGSLVLARVELNIQSIF